MPFLETSIATAYHLDLEMLDICNRLHLSRSGLSMRVSQTKEWHLYAIIDDNHVVDLKYHHRDLDASLDG